MNEKWKASTFKGKMEDGQGHLYRFMKESKRIKWYESTSPKGPWTHLLASKVPKSKFVTGTIIIRTKKYGFQKPLRKKRQWLAYATVKSRQGTIIPDEQLHTVPLHVKKLIQPTAAAMKIKRNQPRAPETPPPLEKMITRSQTASTASATTPTSYELKHDTRTGGYEWYLNGKQVANLRLGIQEQTQMPILIPTPINNN